MWLAVRSTTDKFNLRWQFPGGIITRKIIGKPEKKRRNISSHIYKHPSLREPALELFLSQSEKDILSILPGKESTCF